jgi:hypothetical protein
VSKTCEVVDDATSFDGWHYRSRIGDIANEEARGSRPKPVGWGTSREDPNVPARLEQHTHDCTTDTAGTAGD